MENGAMGPPPSRKLPDSDTTAEDDPQPKTLDETPTSSSTSAAAAAATTTLVMGPPPPNEESAAELEESNNNNKKKQHPTVPYNIPEWSEAPCHRFYLEVLKDGSIIHQFDVCEKGAYMFGRVDLCDFVLDHPTISRFHAVLQFKRNGDAYLYDLASTHGTSINKKQVDKKVYVQLHVGDVIRFGQSTRLYIFQGPPDLMPPEADLKVLREGKMQQEMLDQEASLRRARMEASLSDGISWGMGEDAIEEAEDDGDEITWQTYKGQLTEKQEKTREKVIKRLEKIAHMKKEIDAIRAKDIAQGGLTQGQQTQIARNEQRIGQIMEELENLEETLNESIRESIGARGGMSHGKRKGATEDEELLSDDDEFYDRTKKSSVKKTCESQAVETADSLLDKRDSIMKEMEEKKELLLTEKEKMASETAGETDVGDALDAYMSGLSSQLVVDKTKQLEEEISALQSELNRIFFLLKIVDPSGELAKRRDLKRKDSKPDLAEAPIATKKQPPHESRSIGLGKPINVSKQNEKTQDSKVASIEMNSKLDAEKVAVDAPEDETTVYTVAKPQWLGAVHQTEAQEIQQPEALNIDETGQFVDYKDRQKIQCNVDGEQVKMDTEIESAAPGLIIRKRKETERYETSDNETLEQPTSSSRSEFMAADAVALLLKHKKGYQAEEDDEQQHEKLGRSEVGKDKKRPKRVLGPEKPKFLNTNSDDETWVPPEGQSGDGRTSLNDRYGY